MVQSLSVSFNVIFMKCLELETLGSSLTLLQTNQSPSCARELMPS